MHDGTQPSSDAEVLERLIQEGMARMRWTRKRAEAAAKRYLNRLGKKASPGAILDRIERLNPPRESKHKRAPKKRVIKKRLDTHAEAPTPLTINVAAVKTAKKAKKVKRKRKRMAREAIAKLAPANPVPRKPRTAKERLERALGPDDGGPRRGRGWLLQGGSPGLGRRS